MSRTKFYHMVIDKKTQETKHMINIYSKEELKQVVNKITTVDMKRRDYYFQITAPSVQMFGELYKKKFFEIDGEKNLIHIKPLPNGIRRTRVYRKKINYDKTFANALERIRKTLSDDLGGLDFAFDIETSPRRDDENSTQIQFKIEDLTNIFEKTHSVVMVFDKIKWSYRFVYLSTARDFDVVHKLIKNAFEKHTSSTRNHRARRENNLK
jgi:hypothetical protein